MVFHFLSRSSSPARNFMYRLRNCKSLPANPWLIIQENAAKSHHIQLSSAPNPYSSCTTLSRFFSARSLKESGSALLDKESTAGDRKGEKSDHHSKKRKGKGHWRAWRPLLLFFLTFYPATYLINEAAGTEERVKPMSFWDLSKLLEAGEVDRILVTGSLAIVYVRKSGPELQYFQSPIPFTVRYEPRESRCMINIESPESFTEKLEKAQVALGILRRDHVPVTYIDATNEEAEF